MHYRTLLTSSILFAALAIGFSGCSDSEEDDDHTGNEGGAPPVADLPGVTGEGLIFTVQKVEVADSGVATVEFTITDDEKRPLDLDGKLSPGKVSPSFILSRLTENEAGESTQYVNYTTSVKESEAGDTLQSSTDKGGKYETLSLGRYRYTLGTKIEIKEGDENLTHTLGVYATREYKEVRYVSSVLESWVPDGSDVETVQDVVSDASCASCHTRLEYHGGARRGVGMCNLCHTEENSLNPESGNSFDFQVMIHKIHQGANLPSVQAGDPYYFVGYGGKRQDFSEIHYSWDMKDCSKCHDASQGERWITRPAQKACSSCHDRTYFGAGEVPEGWTKHTAGPRDDSECIVCHGEDSLYPISKSHLGAAPLKHGSTD